MSQVGNICFAPLIVLRTVTHVSSASRISVFSKERTFSVLLIGSSFLCKISSLFHFVILLLTVTRGIYRI
jgi:hypothetical protein